MNLIVLAVVIVAVIGLIAGLGLAVASKVMAVPVDETAEKIQEVLPGANCGACGFSGCAGYAAALASGKTTNTALCAPGGNDVSVEVAKIAGLSAGTVLPSAAAVLCRGNSQSVTKRFNYSGIQSCKMAIQLFGGPNSCSFGCVGFGDCVAECEYNAIHICDGVARINPTACRACKKCVKACPRGIIKMLPLNEIKAAVLCNNHNKGAQTRKECSSGCIGCMKCVKVCEHDAVKIENFCAVVDYEKCTGCGKCHEECPVKCIDLIDLKKSQMINSI